MEMTSKKPTAPVAEPRGFGEHARGLAGEYAHEQGWGLNQDERTRIPGGRQNTDGGNDYDYGARDFGDEPVNMVSTETADDVVPAWTTLTKGAEE